MGTIFCRDSHPETLDRKKIATHNACEISGKKHASQLHENLLAQHYIEQGPSQIMIDGN